MPLTDYLAGFAFFVVIWGAVLMAALLLLRRGFGHLSGAPRVAAFGILSSAGLVGVHVIAGALGILSRWTVALLAIGLLFAVWRLRPGRAVPAAGPADTDIKRLTWSRLLAFATVAALVASVLYALRTQIESPILSIDAVSFHLPGVARWIQSGSIWQNPEFLVHLPTGAYPNNGDILFLAGVLPWRNDAFVRLVNTPMLVLTWVAIYAMARELRASKTSAALMASMVLAVRAITSFALDQVDPDIFLLATFTCGALFLLRQLRRPQRSELVLAGIGIGLAFGAKWYGLSAGIGVVAGWALARRLQRPRFRVLAGQTATVAALILAIGGIWLIRNWVVIGDPVYPARVSILGLRIFNAPHDLYLARYGYSLFDRVGQPSVWLHSVLPDWRVAIGAPGIVLLFSLLGAAVWLGRKRGSLRTDTGQAILMLLVASILITVAYVLTPATAQGFKSMPFPGLVGGNSRYWMPALTLAAPIAAWLVGRLGHWGRLLEAAAVIAVVDGLHQTFYRPIENNVLPLGGVVRFGLEIALAVAVIALLKFWLRRRYTAIPKFAVAVAALGALLVGVVAGDHVQARFNAHRYLRRDSTIDWVLKYAPRGHRIGVAGDWHGGPIEAPIYPLFGPRLHNRVQYVGWLDGGTLLEFQRRAPFAQALRRGRYDLVIVGKAPPPDGPAVAVAWTRDAGYQPVVESDRFVLFASKTPMPG